MGKEKQKRSVNQQKQNINLQKQSVNLRGIVLEMLLETEQVKAFSHHLVKNVLDKYDYLSTKEKAFMKRLYEGTIEKGITLDYYLNRFSRLPVEKMKPAVRNILRMTAYQILFINGVPPAAAVDEAVKLTGKKGYLQLKSFVNGVLRNFCREYGQVELPDAKTQPVLYLSVSYSMPEWIVEFFLETYSFQETEGLLGKIQEVSPVCIRFTARCPAKEQEKILEEWQKAGVSVSRHPAYEKAYRLEHCDNIAALPGFQEGIFTVQDASSMMAVEAAGIQEGDYVLDLCAAPGGKTMLASEYAGKGTGDKGCVEARDISEAKVQIIRENCHRLQLNNVKIKVWDGTLLDEGLIGKADVVLADVPCSGLGIMGKKRDLRYRLSRTSMKELTKLQKAILSNAVQYVKPKGTLLYSTCTISREENEKMAEWICEQFNFQMETERQLLMHQDQTDGFYYAKLVKRGS